MNWKIKYCTQMLFRLSTFFLGSCVCLWACTTFCPGHHACVLCVFSFKEHLRPLLRCLQQCARGETCGSGRFAPPCPWVLLTGVPRQTGLLEPLHRDIRSSCHCSGTELRAPGPPWSLPRCLAALSLFRACLGSTCPTQVRDPEPWVPLGPRPLLGWLRVCACARSCASERAESSQ